MQSLPTIEQVLNSPCTSFWLKDALKALLARDIVDASNDAHVLAALINRECNKALGCPIDAGDYYRSMENEY